MADNLVLNDYYERPYAKAPNMAELPGALLRYLLLTGAIIAGLTALGVYYLGSTAVDGICSMLTMCRNPCVHISTAG